MAGEDNLLKKVAALLSAFDDASWEALASKGLLRRARKDIEKGLEIEVVEETNDVLKIKVPPFVVSMPANGPVGASCNCPAPGICQHILAAGLFLQSHSDQVVHEKVFATEGSIRDEIALLTPDTLKAWIGAGEYRKAIALLEKNTLPAAIEYGETVVIRLMPSATEVRFLPGGGLDGMILPKQQGKRAGVAAILELRHSLGFERPSSVTQQSLVELTGTPRTRKEILDSACALLEEAVSVGLSHASETLVSRLVTLAVSAQGAHMPRVSLALKSVSDEVKSILRREARADEARLLLLIARVYALMDAIRGSSDSQSVTTLAGTSRGQYIEVPELELAGVGAYTWQTGSGYVGLTVMFWANQTEEFFSWSYARPEIQRVDARQRFYGEGPWEGAQSPQQVAASNLKLRHARRTAAGRLSGSTRTTALVLSVIVPEALDFGNRLFTLWGDLQRYVASKQPLGLHEPNPLDQIAVVQPQRFGERRFEPLNQTFYWEVYDAMDQPLTLALPFRDWTKESIKTLEQLSPPRDSHWRFVVRLGYESDGLFVEPISILRPEDRKHPVFQLAFDSLSQSSDTASSPDHNASTESENELIELDEDEIFEDRLPSNSLLYRVLTETNRHLEAIAESGMQTGTRAHRDWFNKSRQEVHGFGLTALATVLDSLAQETSSPQSVVKARYLTHLYSQATAHLG
jgi:hypothetical protein